MPRQLLEIALLPVRLARRVVATPLRVVRSVGRRDRPAPTPSTVRRSPAAPPPVALVDDTAATAPRARAKAATRGRPGGATAKRAAGPTRGEVARLREAQREAEGAPDGPGPVVHVEPPWDGYEDMTADEIIARLQHADPALAGVVRLYESTHRDRATVVEAASKP
jgi:hypothetical protein